VQPIAEHRPDASRFARRQFAVGGGDEQFTKQAVDGDDGR